MTSAEDAPAESETYRLYLGMDGTGIPRDRKARNRAAPRQEQQDPDHEHRRAHVDGRRRGQARQSPGRPNAVTRNDRPSAMRKTADSVSLQRTPAHAETVRQSCGYSTANRVATFRISACRRRKPNSRRFADAERRVILGDGAPWIWALAERHVFRADADPDRRHLPRGKSHLVWTSLKAIYTRRVRRRRAAQWAKQRRDDTIDRRRASDAHSVAQRPRPTRPRRRRRRPGQMRSRLSSCTATSKPHALFRRSRRRGRSPCASPSGIESRPMLQTVPSGRRLKRAGDDTGRRRTRPPTWARGRPKSLLTTPSADVAIRSLLGTTKRAPRWKTCTSQI